VLLDAQPEALCTLKSVFGMASLLTLEGGFFYFTTNFNIFLISINPTLKRRLFIAGTFVALKYLF
jgi:hypothetical protein